MPNVQTDPPGNGPDVNSSPALTTDRPGSGQALLHLARMSGTGSAFGQADYVAISPLAVASLIFGLFSFLSLVFNMFLAAAAAGVILGLLALQKIRHSNGTQSGVWLAGAGMLMSLAIGGTVMARTMITWSKERGYTSQCTDMVARFGEEVKARHFDNIYDNLMTSTFRDKWNRADFTVRVQSALGNPDIGNLESFQSNGEPITFQAIPDSDATLARTIARIKFNKFEFKQEVILNNLEGDWKIDDIPELFVKKKKVPGGR